MNDSTDKKLGLALGSGASRGWSHIGVIKALLDAGYAPDIVCGSSVGAMVGASYLAGNLGKLEDWVLGSSRTDVLRFFSFRLANSAFVDIERLNWFLREFVADVDLRIEDLPKPYAAVCTDLKSGREVSLQEGLVAEAVRASMAMPGLFPPEQSGDRWLVDGGLVNPVPVTVCRALGADVVIAVNLNSHILTRHYPTDDLGAEDDSDSVIRDLKKHAIEYSNRIFPSGDKAGKSPGLFSTIAHTINIFQDQITRSRLEADPADVLITPEVGDIGMFDFQRASDAIKEGEGCVGDALADIRESMRTSR